MRSKVDPMLFAGRANPALAKKIAGYIGVPLSRAEVGSFGDGEISIEICENVRGRDVFVIQPTCPPANDNLMELLIMIDALHRASAMRITAVVPYFGYARQDRRVRSERVPISAKLVADMITAAGANRLLTVDLHSEQIQGFFTIPVDNIYGSPVLLQELQKQSYPADIVVVSPDIGGVIRSRAIAKQLKDAELVVIDKRRPRSNDVEVMNVIGRVEGRFCLLTDDIVDTAGTLCEAAAALKEQGALQVKAFCTHPVLSGEAVSSLNASALDMLMVTDTIPLRPDAQSSERIQLLDIARLLAESIRRISNEESLSAMFY